jgi:hypothetical protein
MAAQSGAAGEGPSTKTARRSPGCASTLQVSRHSFSVPRRRRRPTSSRPFQGAIDAVAVQNAAVTKANALLKALKMLAHNQLVSSAHDGQASGQGCAARGHADDRESVGSLCGLDPRTRGGPVDPKRRRVRSPLP